MKHEMQTKRNMAVLLAGVVLLAWGTALSKAATVVPDQGQIFKTDGIIELGTDSWSQSITTGIAGQLVAIQFQIESVSAPLPGVFHFAILGGGDPLAGPVLHAKQLTIHSSDVEDRRLYTWEVKEANLRFGVGDAFTFGFRAEQPGYILAANDPPGYSGGELFKNGVALPAGEPNDLGFITYVPEPSAALLTVLGLCAIVLPSRRRTEVEGGLHRKPNFGRGRWSPAPRTAKAT